jgi:hypothetical protein
MVDAYYTAPRALHPNTGFRDRQIRFLEQRLDPLYFFA